MSTQGIESVLSRAMTDPAFADALFEDTEKALVGFDLTTEEIAKFKGMSRSEFEALAPEDRKSMAIATHFTKHHIGNVKY